MTDDHPYDQYMRPGDGTVWPSPLAANTLEWTLRYGEPTLQDRLWAASIVSAYRELLQGLTLDRVAEIRRLTRAQRPRLTADAVPRLDTSAPAGPAESTVRAPVDGVGSPSAAASPTDAAHRPTAEAPPVVVQGPSSAVQRARGEP